MTRGMITRGLMAALAAVMWLSGCSGVLLESKGDGGSVDRLRLAPGEQWKAFDNRPRYLDSKYESHSEKSIMLKREATF